MKHLCLIYAFVLSAIVSMAQTIMPDYQSFSQTDILGTARYVSMAGAFTALGGDVSAAYINPAALGVFRHSEVSVTVDCMFDNVTQAYTNNKTNTFKFSVPQVSWVMHHNHSYRQKGLIESSIMLQYHRIKSYARNGFFSQSNSDVSLTDLMVDLTNGLSDLELGDNNWYNNPDVGTLSEAAYQLYLIDPDVYASYPDIWIPHYSSSKLSNYMQVNRSGAIDAYTFAWGGNISNCVHIGISANVRSLNYSKSITINEQFWQDGSFSLTSSVSATGIGFDATIGIIAIPVQGLRLGISFQTPSWMMYSVRSYTEGSSFIFDENNYKKYSSFYFDAGKVSENYSTMPLRLSTGLAYQFASGVLSAQYDWQYNFSNPDFHSLKLGTEFVLSNNFFLRAGYAAMSTFKKNNFYFSPSYDDLRTDTDFKNIHLINYASVGFGFRNRHIVTELAYQFCAEKSTISAFARTIYDVESDIIKYQSVDYDMTALTNRIVFTFAWTWGR